MAHKTKLQLTFLFAIALTISALASVLMFSTGAAQSAVSGATKASVPSVLLPDGRVFSVGGAGTVSAVARISETSGSNDVLLKENLHYARSGHTATVLPTGQVLIVGGVGADGNLVRYAEIYDPVQQQFQIFLGGNFTPRVAHSATLLTDGQLLVVGGRDAQGNVIAQAELWNSRTGKSETLAADVLAGRAGHEARLLADGRVYVVGGANTGTGQGDGAIFDPAQRRFGYVDNATPLDPAADSAAAFLSGSTPLFSAHDVPVDAAITLRFSKPIDMASLNESTVTLSGPAGVTTARVVAAEGGMLAFLAPRGQLFPGSVYSVFVSGARERNGTALPFTAFRFNTVSLAKSAPGTDVPGAGSSTGKPKKPKPGEPSPPSTGIPKPTPPIGAGPPVLVKPPVSVLSKPQEKKLAANTVDDEDWTPNASHHNGKWRTGRHAPHKLKDSVKAMRAAYRGSNAARSVQMLQGGGTALTGQVLRLNSQPLENVNLRIGNIQARTDSMGRFIFSGLTPGRHEMIIDGRRDSSGTARPYGYYVASVDLKADTLNELRHTIWMPKIRSKDIVRIASPVGQETVVTHPDLPGLELRIPPGTVIRDREGKIVTEFAITPVPVDQAPFPVPENFPMYFMISPGGAVIQGLDPKSSQGIRVIYPNYLNAAPGTEARFWNFDPSDRGWFIYGKGKVSDDGAQVIPDPGVALYDWMVFGYGTFNPGKDGPEPAPPTCEDGAGASGPATDGDPVDCFTGLFLHARTDLALKDVMPAAIQRVYRQGDTVVRPFGYGTSHQLAMYLQAPLINGVRSVNIIDLILSNGARVRYRLVAGTPATPGYWEHTESASRFYKSRLYQASAPNSWEIKMRDGSFYNFSAHGLYLTRMRDRYGNFVEFTESAGNITRLTTQSGRYMELFYDTSSRIKEIRDFEGRSVLYQYDLSSGMLTRVTYPDTTFEQYGYDSAGRMTTVRDRRGYTMVTNEYDANGRVKKQTLADSSIYLFNYVADSVNRVLQTDVTDPRGVVRRIRFDHPGGYPTSNTRAFGTPFAQTTTTERDPASGRAVLVTDALGRKTRYTYDPAGNIASITSLHGTAAAITESFTWTADFNQIASYTDPLNHTTTLSYDNLGKLSQVLDPLNQVTQVTMDGQGRLIRIYDPGTTREFTLSYDQGDLRTFTANGRTTTFQPDAAGRVLAVVNPAGEQTRYQYDLNDRVRNIVDAHGGLTQLDVDAHGNLRRVTDPKGTATAFSYDSRNRRETKTHPTGQIETFNYDGRSNLIRHIDRYARTTTYDYDPLNRVQTVTRPDSTATILGYDPGNRLLSLTESPANPAADVTRTYDDLNRLKTETTTAGTMTYTYDNAGNRRSLSAPGQASVTYDYDNADRLDTITQGSSIVRFGYDSASRRTSLNLPSGINVAYNYNAADLTDISYFRNATIITNLGNLTYSYDPAGRITTIGGSLADTGLPSEITASHGIDHRLNTQNSDSFTYDAAGNIQTRTDTCGTTTYTWNVKGQLTQIAGFTPSCAPLTASFTYDALGRRQAKTINGVTTSFVYDGYTPIQERQGATTTNLLTGPGIDEYLSRSDGSTTRYFLPNHLGSTLALADASGTLTTRYSYSPFGETTQSGEGSSNPFQYTGRENDNTGLYYYRARYYDPKLQRFISSDPIGLAGGLNTYAYVLNNPLRYIDPFGLWTWPSPSDVVNYWGEVFGGAGDFGQAYVDQWRATNTVGGAHNGWANQDVYFHCRANCEAAQRGPAGEDIAQCISNARESWDELWGQSPSDTRRDQAANLLGRSGGSMNPSGSCQQICGSLRPGGSFPAGW